MNVRTVKDFSRRVRELMEKNRYSQKQLCDLCGVTEAAFSKYMTTDRLPQSETLANMANALHTTSDYLLGIEGNYDFDKLKVVLASSKDDLSRNQKNELLRILMDEYKN